MNDFTLKLPPKIGDFLKERNEEAKAKIETQTNTTKSHLSPIKHPQKDFFIADLFDATSYRIDLASMEYPLFSLRAGDTREIHWEHNGLHIFINPSTKGRATIHDKDLWIYAISKLISALNDGKEISRMVRFTIYDYLVTTNRGTSGEYYSKTKDALERLSATRIKIEHEDKKRRIAVGFGLIDGWKIIEEKDGRMVRVEMELSKWLYQSIIDAKVKKISENYFLLRKPLDRRIYELACKHCGEQEKWVIGLALLLKKSGSTAPLRNFRISVKSLAESDDLPDYTMQFDDQKDLVIFKQRDYEKKQAKAFVKKLRTKNVG